MVSQHKELHRQRQQLPINGKSTENYPDFLPAYSGTNANIALPVKVKKETSKN